jgi:hypothetical protein
VLECGTGKHRHATQTATDVAAERDSAAAVVVGRIDCCKVDDGAMDPEYVRNPIDFN